MPTYASLILRHDARQRVSLYIRLLCSITEPSVYNVTINMAQSMQRIGLVVLDVLLPGRGSVYKLMTTEDTTAHFGPRNTPSRSDVGLSFEKLQMRSFYYGIH